MLPPPSPPPPPPLSAAQTTPCRFAHNEHVHPHRAHFCTHTRPSSAPLPCLDSPPPLAAAPQVQQFYQQHNPSKLSEVPALLEKYRGREPELIAKLAQKYGAGGAGAVAGQQPQQGFGGTGGGFGQQQQQQQQQSSPFGQASASPFGAPVPSPFGQTPPQQAQPQPLGFGGGSGGLFQRPPTVSPLGGAPGGWGAPPTSNVAGGTPMGGVGVGMGMGGGLFAGSSPTPFGGNSGGGGGLFGQPAAAQPFGAAPMSGGFQRRF